MMEYFYCILGLFRGAMLGHNLAISDFIFDCILSLMPFPSCFEGEILVLTYSHFMGVNFILL